MNKTVQTLLIAVGIAIAVIVGYKMVYGSAMTEAAKKEAEARAIAESARQAQLKKTEKNISDSLAGITGIFGAPQIGKGVGDLIGAFLN